MKAKITIKQFKLAVWPRKAYNVESGWTIESSNLATKPSELTAKFIKETEKHNITVKPG